VRVSLLIVSIMWTGMRIVRAWSAMRRVMAWRIHHVAYVENLYPRRCSNFSTAFMQADVPFLDQVEELQAAVRVLLGDRDDQAEVRDDELVLGLVGLLFALAHHALRLLDVLVRDAELLFELPQTLAVLGDPAL
jgi:hypothetical protein